MPLNTCISNSQEALIDRLAQNTTQPLSSPLQPETFITQHNGMNHWLSTKLAERRGICANIQFFYPNAFIYSLLKQTNTGLLERSPFEPAILTWKIMGILPACIEKKGFEPLKSYLSDRSEIKTFQIAKKISDVFDQYIIFRPSMLKKWGKGILSHGTRDEKWQAVLWKQLVKDAGPLYRARLVEDFYGQLEKNSETAKALPERIEIFGISVLPPFHLNFFSRISEHTRVDLFLLNPCREYWGDIMSQKEEAKLLKKGIASEETYITRGHPLLSSLGKSGREFFDMITALEGPEDLFFNDIDKNSMLSCLQSGILDLKDQNEKIIRKDDFSIQMHSCHSPMREIEVLHDQILFMFEQDKNLKPHDIIVMTPDINTYAPFIRAVFDSPEKENKKIPFSISDLSLLSENSIINTFLSFLDISRGRFGVTEVIPLLESPAVQKKFSFSEKDISLIKSWLEKTRIRWGRDKESKSSLGLPPTGQNTWQSGLDRLLLGYALPGQGRDMFSGILPFDDIEGSSAQTLGRFIKFTKDLFSLSKDLSFPKSLKQWAAALMKILNTFLKPDDENRQKMRSLTEAIIELENIQLLSGFNHDLNLEVISEHLKTLLKQKSSSSGFMAGSVTFCAMESSRSIPAKVICLIGMNDGIFPRISYKPGFDLISEKPQACDPSSKNEDRYLFLEILISASEKLYISYTGQHIRDNSIIPPAVLVSELTDFLEENFFHPEKDLREHLLTKHPLQPFSPDYFLKGSRLYSYSTENLKCAKTLSENKHMDSNFIESSLPLPKEEFMTLDIMDLSNFFFNPSKFLLQNRFNLSLEIQEKSFEDRENFSIKGLERYIVDQLILNGLSAGLKREDLFEIAESSGMLPHGTIGESEYDIAFKTVSDFLKPLEVFIKDKENKAIAFDVNLGNFRLKGTIKNLYENRLVKYRCAKIKPRDIISLWIEHLALGLVPHMEKNSSILSGLSEKRTLETWEFNHIDNSETILLGLLELYYKGLTNPLPFFPEASFAYLKKFHKEQDKDLALIAAEKKLVGDEYSSGDLNDAYQNLCFKDSSCLNKKFIETATAVYEPIIKNRKKLVL